MKSKHQQRVEEFMEKAGQEVPNVMKIPEEGVRRLRAKLILEEALETIEALGFVLKWNGRTQLNRDLYDFDEVLRVDLIGVIDGCCDIKVVTTGTLSAFGVPDEPFQEEVDEANLRKFEVPRCPLCMEPMSFLDPDFEDIDDSHWTCTDHEETFRLPKESGPYTRSDGKHIKPPYWTPPNHQKLLEDLKKNA